MTDLRLTFKKTTLILDFLYYYSFCTAINSPNEIELKSCKLTEIITLWLVNKEGH